MERKDQSNQMNQNKNLSQDERPVKFNPSGKYNLDFIDWDNEANQIYSHVDYSTTDDNNMNCPIYGMEYSTFRRLMQEEFQRFQVENDGFYEVGDSEQLSQEDIQKLKQFKIKMTKDQCPICVNNFKKGEMVRKLPCEHIFHENCILPWFSKKSNCPNCRFNIKEHFEKNK